MNCFASPHGALYRLSLTGAAADTAGRRRDLRARRIARNRRRRTGSEAPVGLVRLLAGRFGRRGKTAA